MEDWKHGKLKTRSVNRMNRSHNDFSVHVISDIAYGCGLCISTVPVKVASFGCIPRIVSPKALHCVLPEQKIFLTQYKHKLGSLYSPTLCSSSWKCNKTFGSPWFCFYTCACNFVMYFAIIILCRLILCHVTALLSTVSCIVTCQTMQKSQIVKLNILKLHRGLEKVL